MVSALTGISVGLTGAAVTITHLYYAGNSNHKLMFDFTMDTGGAEGELTPSVSGVNHKF